MAAKNRQRLGYRRIVQLLVYLVIVPTVLILFVGIVLMFLGSVFNILFGVLTVSFVLVAVTGVVLVLVFVRREANLSELQADFVSKVSHELRTPLTSIRLFVETMARSRGDAATQNQCLDALGLETERLTQLIERLLDWGRGAKGRRGVHAAARSAPAGRLRIGSRTGPAARERRQGRPRRRHQ